MVLGNGIKRVDLFLDESIYKNRDFLFLSHVALNIVSNDHLLRKELKSHKFQDIFSRVWEKMIIGSVELEI